MASIIINIDNNYHREKCMVCRYRETQSADKRYCRIFNKELAVTNDGVWSELRCSECKEAEKWFRTMEADIAVHEATASGYEGV